MATIPRRRARPRQRGARPVRFAIDQFDRMARAGIFGPDELIELVLGRLFRKMSANPPHMQASSRVRRRFYTLLPENEWAVFDADSSFEIPSPARLDGLPMPDVFVARGALDSYNGRRPGHRDVVLVVEVADTTLDYDLGLKLKQYALAEIPEYWVVNLVDRRVEVYTQPTGPDPHPAYRHRQDYGPGTTVPLVLDGQAIAQIAVDELLPPQPPAPATAP
jgi:Uma2 family endonuclease